MVICMSLNGRIDVENLNPIQQLMLSYLRILRRNASENQNQLSLTRLIDNPMFECILLPAERDNRFV